MKKQYWPLSILLLGILLRWYAIDWSLPQIFHPDETRLLYAVNDISLENLNPKFFAYGSLPIYLLKMVQVSTEAISKFSGSSGHVNFFVVGRALSASFGSLTLIILYLLGTRFFSKRVGFLSTAFLAFTVLHIQLSHFLTVDVMLTFFIVLTLYIFAQLLEGKHLYRYYGLAGIAIGLSLATKISALPVYAAFFVTHILTLSKHKGLRHGRRRPLRLWLVFLLALLLSGIVFFVCQPYAFLDYHEFQRQIKEQSDMVRGITQPPYVIQYEHTPRYWYQLKQMVHYSMGWPLGIITVFGSLFLFVHIFREVLSRNPQFLMVLFAWVIPVFWIIGGFKVKFLRYMLPLIPFFCLLGAIFVDWLYERFPARKVVLHLLVGAILVYSAFYSLAFLSIYHRDDPRIQASRWLYEHLEEGSSILTELWEFAPIVAADGHHPMQYRGLQLDLYNPDTEAKIQKIAQQLSEADAIVLATKRLYGSILRIPERLSLTGSLYKLLFDGMLGFEPLPPFTLYPSLFGITFNDDFADESFSVYDHPKTIVFQKTHEICADELYELIVTAPPLDKQSAEQLRIRLLAFPALEKDSGSGLLSSTESTSSSPAAMNSRIPENLKNHSQWQAIVLWLIAVELLAIMVFPLTSLTFRALPDYGYGISKAVGILLPGYLLWLGVNVKLLMNSQRHLFLIIGCLLFASTALFLKYRRFLTTVVFENWKIFCLYEGVFLLGFSAFLLFRAYNPDIFWSESSMDFSILNALMRSETFPPPDPWISGFPLNYYYLGHHLVTMLTTLTGIAPQIAYNLAFALFPALVILEVLSVVYNLTKRYVYGVVGVVLTAIIGNLDGFFLLAANWRTRFAAFDAWVARSPLLNELIGREHYYRFFRPAHEVIPHTVHEFPFWTFIFVDLHAHLLNMPFLLATFLVGMNLLFHHRGIDDSLHPVPDSEKSFSLPFLLETLLYMLIIGTLNVISSWDYPTGIIFLLLIAFLKIYVQRQTIRRRRWPETLRPLWYILILIPGSLVLYAPFYSSFSRKGMGLGLTGGMTTRFSDVLTIFGLFLFVILSFLIFRAAHPYFTGHPWRMLTGLLVGFWALYQLILHQFALNYAVLCFFLGLLLFGAYVFLKAHPTGHHQDRLPDLYIGTCLIYACLIVAGCEIVFVRDFLQGGVSQVKLPFLNLSIPVHTGDYKRMNTIFKFYLPAWFLLSFAAAYGIAHFHTAFTIHQAPTKNVAKIVGRMCWLTCLGILVLASQIFPFKAIHARRHQQDVYPRTYLPPTLDGLAYIEATKPDEYRAIQWLNQHVVGTPVILEASGDDYLYEYARISANTGLPTVLGWGSHAEQREHWGQASQRRNTIREIYTSPNILRVQQLLRTYQVEYVYIGSTERRDFTMEQLQKFEQHPEFFEAVFRSGETVVYRIHYS